MPTWPVPEHIQKQPSFPVTDNDYVKMLGFEEVFPGYTGQALAEAWDTDATFRWAGVFVANGYLSRTVMRWTDVSVFNGRAYIF
jgi:hypothetical protein